MATRVAGAAEISNEQRLKALKRTLWDALRTLTSDPVPPLSWSFTPLAVNRLGAPAACTVLVIDDHARRHSHALRHGLFRSQSASRTVLSLFYLVYICPSDPLLHAFAYPSAHSPAVQ